MSPSRPAQEPLRDAAKQEPDGYEAILAAVMETARGRWFIAEFGRRNRHAETEKVLDGLRRIERRLSGETARAGGLHPDIADLAAIFGLPEGSAPPGLTGELVAEIARELGQAADATRDQILSARGALKGLADAHADPRLCAALDRAMVAIDGLAGAQGAAGRKVEQLAAVISSIRERIAVAATAAIGASRAPAAPLRTPAVESQPHPAAETATLPAMAVPDAPAPFPPAPAEDTAHDDESIFADSPPTEAESPSAPFTDGLPIAAVGPGARLRLAIADEEQALRDLAAESQPIDDSAPQPRTLAELDRLSYEQRYALFAS
jgi:hypothetical protein